MIGHSKKIIALAGERYVGFELNGDFNDHRLGKPGQAV
jgi:hypothetical protein